MKELRFQPKDFGVFPVIGLLLSFLLCINVSAQNEKEPIRWRQALDQHPEWYSSEEAIRIADNLLIYQHHSGGWPKNIDMARILSAKDIKDIQNAQKEEGTTLSGITIDNDATYTQMSYLARVFEDTGHERFKESFLQGLDYLLEAQYENGGWPQYYPIRKGYYEMITFNDDAMIGVMNILRDVARGKYSFVDSSRVLKGQQAIDKGLKIILKTQIEVNGELTAWCTQYDPINLEPAGGRSYELPSISGSESVGIVRYLMGIENPSAEIIHSVKGAVGWFERVKIKGVRIILKEDTSLPRGYDRLVGFDPEGASPLWARFYEIGTNYPMFVGRDGIVKYAYSEIEHERRVGYSYLGGWAEKLINEDYPMWCEIWGIKNK